MEKNKICLITVCIGNQYKYIDITINSLSIEIDCLYILHYDTFYQYETKTGKNVINIDLEKYDYNICKCFNKIKNNSSVWIVWDSVYFFNSNNRDNFYKNLYSINVDYDMCYIFGVNLCLDIYNYKSDDVYSCKTGGCFIVSSTQQMNEESHCFSIVKNSSQRIKYDLNNNLNYYFFNFADAVHEELMLIKCFKNEYVQHMYKTKMFMAFSKFYSEKYNSHVDNGCKYLMNCYLKRIIHHSYDLPDEIAALYFYKCENGYRSTIFSGTQYNDYSMTVLTLVRNNKHYLKESIASLISQTSSKWNCIIINDGSDDTITYNDFLTKETMLFEKHFKIINLTDWNGLVKCHKLGLMNATHDIVGILDVDDTLDKTAIEKVLNVYNITKKDNIFVYTNFYVCNENMKKVSLGFGTDIDVCLLNDRCGNHFRTFKTKHYFLTKGFDDDLQFGGEDQDILFKLETVCQPVFLDEPLYLYRVPSNNTSTITSLKTITKYSLYISIFKNIIDRYGNLDFVLYIHSDLSKVKCRYKNVQKIVYNNCECYAELCSNDIYILDCSNVIGINVYLNEYVKNKKHKFKVGINWNYLKKCFMFVQNEKLNMESFCKIHPAVYFSHVYILNLTQDVTKKNRMQQLFNNLNIEVEFVEAIYGKHEPYLSEFKNKYSSTLRNAGAYGYSLTMIKIFKDAIKKKYKKILVCDDDIIIHNDFLNKFNENIRKIPFDWKVLFFGLSGPWSGVNVNPNFKKFNYNNSFITNLSNCDGSYCVGYDVKILEKLIDVTQRFDAPFDTAIIKYFNTEKISNIYAFYPYLVLADTTTSDIQFRESDTFDNFSANQFKFRQNMQLFDIHSMLNKNYDKFYSNPYPKVSLVMIIKNDHCNIEMTIKSFLNQSYNNSELLIVIINSMENKYSCLNKYVSFDNIKILKLDSLDYSDCVKLAISKISGYIVGILSNDEHMLSNRIKKQVRYMNDNNYIFAGCNIIYTQLKTLEFEDDENHLINRSRQLLPNEDHFGISFNTNSLLFKKHLFYKHEFGNNLTDFVKNILLSNSQKFNCDIDMFSFLHNSSNNIYGKINDQLIIEQGNKNIHIIPTVNKSDEEKIKKIPVKINKYVIQTHNNQQSNQNIQQTQKIIQQNTQHNKNSQQNKNNYNMIMKLKKT